MNCQDEAARLIGRSQQLEIKDELHKVWNSLDRLRLNGRMGGWGYISHNSATSTRNSSFTGMTPVGRGYFSNGQGLFTNQSEQAKAGNYGAWNANHFGASQSSPFSGDDSGQFSQLPPHIP